MDEHRPILVTGAHRTSTSWVGKMLCASGEAAYISEPLNVWHRPGVFGAPIAHWYTYICRDNEDVYLPAYQQLLSLRYHWLEEVRSIRSRKDFLRMLRDGGIFLRGRIFHQRPLLKDPFAVFSIPWFIERLDCRVVVTVRHPLGFASSLKRLNWQFDMADLLAQPYLLRDGLDMYQSEMQRLLETPTDIIGQAALLWQMVYGWVAALQERGYPLIIVRHEDLSLQPVDGFRELYQQLDLKFTEKARQTILATSSADNPKELSSAKRHSVRLDSRSNLANWRKRLSVDEVERIYQLTGDVVKIFYGEESWENDLNPDPAPIGGEDNAFTTNRSPVGGKEKTITPNPSPEKGKEKALNPNPLHSNRDTGNGTLPLVSIVTPSFNQARFLEETIQSVLNQDYPNIEYIIIDGGSTDGSLDIIQRYAQHLAWWVSEKDNGQTDAINKGFSRAAGEIFAWLNSDDTYLPNAVSEAVAYLLNHPEVGMVYGDANLIDEGGRVVGKFPARQTDYPRLRRGYVHIPQQAAFFRADLWHQVAPLDPSFFFAMDYDLWVRLAKIAPLMYVPRLWANFRLHGSGKTIAADDRCWPEMLRVHYREGGAWLSPIVIKSGIRRIAAPYLNWKRRRMINKFRT